MFFFFFDLSVNVNGNNLILDVYGQEKRDSFPHTVSATFVYSFKEKKSFNTYNK